MAPLHGRQLQSRATGCRALRPPMLPVPLTAPPCATELLGAGPGWRRAQGAPMPAWVVGGRGRVGTCCCRGGRVGRACVRASYVRTYLVQCMQGGGHFCWSAAPPSA